MNQYLLSEAWTLSTLQYKTVQWAVNHIKLQSKRNQPTISDTKWQGTSFHVFCPNKTHRSVRGACPEMRVQYKSSSLSRLSERFTIKTVNYFTPSAKTTEISTYTKPNVYVVILKVYSLFYGTILYASEMAPISLLMLCFFAWCII